MGIEECFLLRYIGQVVDIYDSRRNLKQKGVLVPTQEDDRAKYGLAYRSSDSEPIGIINIYPTDVLKVTVEKRKNLITIELTSWPYGEKSFARKSGVNKSLDALLRQHGL